MERGSTPRVASGSSSAGTALRITHVSVSQASRSLEAEGIITSAAAPTDARRRQLSLTAKGLELVAQLASVGLAFNDAAEESNAEAGDIVRLLDRLDDVLEQKCLFDRIAEKAGIAAQVGEDG
jgi:MarR family transcriptional regulator, organic hydroperoxide resistance regulator